MIALSFLFNVTSKIDCVGEFLRHCLWDIIILSLESIISKNDIEVRSIGSAQTASGTYIIFLSTCNRYGGSRLNVHNSLLKTVPYGINLAFKFAVQKVILLFSGRVNGRTNLKRSKCSVYLSLLLHWCVPKNNFFY